LLPRIWFIVGVDLGETDLASRPTNPRFAPSRIRAYLGDNHPINESQKANRRNPIAAAEENFESKLGGLAAELGTTAVFDGVGGDLMSRIAPNLPMNSTIYIYGFSGGAVPVSLPSLLFMMKNLIMKRFSNFESATVKGQQKLAAALKELEGLIDDPMFTTRIGREVQFRSDSPSHGF
jgi:NADPH:quinone reductase-like Zn-dependent oxidoreductase